MEGGSFLAAVMCRLQQLKYVDKAMYYCFSYSGVYNGFLDRNDHSISPAWYPFKAFGELYALKTAAETKCEGDIYAQAATDGQKSLLLVSNYNSEDEETLISLKGVNGKNVYFIFPCLCLTQEIELFSIKIKIPPYTERSVFMRYLWHPRPELNR